MSNDELTAALWEKMAAEQERYKSELLKLPPEKILENAYKPRYQLARRISVQFGRHGADA